MYKWNDTRGVSCKTMLDLYEECAYQWLENKELTDVAVLWCSWPSYLVVFVLLRFVVVVVDLMWEYTLWENMFINSFHLF